MLLEILLAVSFSRPYCLPNCQLYIHDKICSITVYNLRDSRAVHLPCENNLRVDVIFYFHSWI